MLVEGLEPEKNTGIQVQVQDRQKMMLVDSGQQLTSRSGSSGRQEGSQESGQGQ